MNAAPPAGRLTGGARAALLDAMRRTAPAAAPEPDAPLVQPRREMGFESLPAYQLLNNQRSMADAMGLRFPFYRTHAARAGARSVVEGHKVVNFASYDYLGLNGHPEITAAVGAATAEWGTSVSASRITAGEARLPRSTRDGAGRHLPERGGTRLCQRPRHRHLHHRGPARTEGSYPARLADPQLRGGRRTALRRHAAFLSA